MRGYGHVLCRQQRCSALREGDAKAAPGSDAILYYTPKAFDGSATARGAIYKFTWEAPVAIAEFEGLPGAVPPHTLAVRWQTHIFWRQITVLGTTMGSPREFAAMLTLYEDGRLRPVVDKVFHLDEAAAVHRLMEEAWKFGKIVLCIH